MSRTSSYPPSQVAALDPGDEFLMPDIGQGFAGAHFTILEISASRTPGAALLRVRSRRGSEQKVVLSEKLVVEVLGRKASGSKASEPKVCKCRNHMGSRKTRHKSRAAAVKAILDRHLQFGRHRVYECPRQRGIFHVTSR